MVIFNSYVNNQRVSIYGHWWLRKSSLSNSDGLLISHSMAGCIARGFPTICPGNDDVAESPGELPDLPGRKDGVARDECRRCGKHSLKHHLTMVWFLISTRIYHYLGMDLKPIISTYLSIYLSIYLSTYLSIYLIYLIYLSIYLPSYLSIYLIYLILSILSIYPIYPIYPIYLSILSILSIYLSYLSIYPIYLSILLSIYPNLSIYLSIQLSIHLSIYLFYGLRPFGTKCRDELDEF